MNIETRVTAKRGCGYRKPGGLYLVSPAGGMPCCKLPFILTVCPCCGAGIKPARGWTWIDADALFSTKPCTAPDAPAKFFTGGSCPLSLKIGKAGLIWVGEKFYPTAEDFMKEAQAQGISRRVSAIPKGFKLSETWVLLAHRLAVSHILPEGCSTNGEKVIHQAAIFRVFKVPVIWF